MLRINATKVSKQIQAAFLNLIRNDTFRMILISFENRSVPQSWVQSDCGSTPPTCQDEEVRGGTGWRKGREKCNLLLLKKYKNINDLQLYWAMWRIGQQAGQRVNSLRNNSVQTTSPKMHFNFAWFLTTLIASRLESLLLSRTPKNI